MSGDFVTPDVRHGTPLLGPCVVGIDLSSRAIDLVKLDENTQHAQWTHIPLAGTDSWDRTRSIRPNMPTAGYWANVYLCAIEKPYGPSRLAQTVLMRVQGATLASIPAPIETWEVTPQTWKAHLPILHNTKPTPAAYPDFDVDGWPQDALDALGVALYARDTNAHGIRQALTA